MYANTISMSKETTFCLEEVLIPHCPQTDKNILWEQKFLLNIIINRLSIPKINVSGVQIQANIAIRGEGIRTSQKYFHIS